jgi:hypothetical protein
MDEMEEAPGLVWEEPGRSRRSKHNHNLIAERLKEQPGRWAKVLDGVNVSYANHIKEGDLGAYRPAGSFEAVCRGTDKDFHCTIYARYIGRFGEYRSPSDDANVLRGT